MVFQRPLCIASANFYKSDAFPVSKPIVLKHWRKKDTSDKIPIRTKTITLKISHYQKCKALATTYWTQPCTRENDCAQTNSTQDTRTWWINE